MPFGDTLIEGYVGIKHCSAEIYQYRCSKTSF